MRAIDPAREPAPILRALIAAVPDNRLRDLVLELALHGAPSEEPATPAPAPAPAVAPTPAKRKRTRPGWSAARRAAFEKAKAAAPAAAARPDYNTVRRERRAAERVARAAQKAGNGHSNGNGEGISAEAFWAHARRLSPREPWRAITREFGGSDADAREALRAMLGDCHCGRGAIFSSANDRRYAQIGKYPLSRPCHALTATFTPSRATVDDRPGLRRMPPRRLSRRAGEAVFDPDERRRTVLSLPVLERGDDRGGAAVLVTEEHRGLAHALLDELALDPRKRLAKAFFEPPRRRRSQA